MSRSLLFEAILVLVLVLPGCQNPTETETLDSIPPPIGTMKSIQGGTFFDGSSNITVSSFRLGVYSITQAQYLAITGNNPSNHNVAGTNATNTATSNNPVENVTWYDAVEFCNKLSTKEGLTPVYLITGRSPSIGYPVINATVTINLSHNGYRLPTNVQRMWAAMGGVSDSKSGDIVRLVNTGGYKKAFAGDTGSNPIDEYAWTSTNTLSTRPVGQKKPNELGLYDMSGNVQQLCWDTKENNRLAGGQGWKTDTRNCAVWIANSVYAYGYDNDIGFRVSLP